MHATGIHLKCLNKVEEAIQMSTNNICFYKEEDKKYMAVICRIWNAWLCTYRGMYGN